MKKNLKKFAIFTFLAFSLFSCKEKEEAKQPETTTEEKLVQTTTLEDFTITRYNKEDKVTIESKYTLSINESCPYTILKVEGNYAIVLNSKPTKTTDVNKMEIDLPNTVEKIRVYFWHDNEKCSINEAIVQNTFKDKFNKSRLDTSKNDGTFVIENIKLDKTTPRQGSDGGVVGIINNP